ncbi:vomeronasal type-2 receptor 26-like [Pyxicephalus adspersus]|uniref:vomeronasal type-2 receptor 26-like n=1 Tax=Pyxicephalus adspersus TaxID=30357 RepID=UPI003B59C319
MAVRVGIDQTRITRDSTGQIRVVDSKGYTHLLAFMFAINEINLNPDILPNVTLGYHVYDSCGHMNKAIKDVLQILSGHTRTAPNYSCMERDNVAGFIGDLRSDTTLQMARLLNLYGYTQVRPRNYTPILIMLGYSKTAKVLHDLLKNDVVGPEKQKKFSKRPFGDSWTPACEEAFVQLKKKLTEAPVLAYADARKPYVLHVDACFEGLGSVLHQEYPTGLQPIAYISRSLNPMKNRLISYSLRYPVKKCNLTKLNMDPHNCGDKMLYRVFTAVNILARALHNVYNYLKIKEPESEIHRLRYKDPKGRCSECLPGFRKALKEGNHICCYDCVQCSEGEISNYSDSENCQTCPEDEWPNDAKNICVSKITEYLSYEKDVLVIMFSVSSVLFAAISIFILGLFFWFRSTPMVKANNRNLSFILLCSLTLSFLSVFLFLGRPVDITCMLQQISFGIVFTISVSSILAKTIMVSIAFKATRPGSSCRKWVGVKLPNTVMLFCSSIQVINGILWLSISPPFQEYDKHSYPGKIIVQCNEGSTLEFYITLGYMGFLAAVSFVLAFMVRTLPDSFNEAKYITFSMLGFCSVWIAMIPAYLSTKGKYMVAVEVFAILTSSAGLLGCIFIPKLYLLLFKPELNTRKNMLERRTL